MQIPAFAEMTRGKDSNDGGNGKGEDGNDGPRISMNDERERAARCKVLIHQLQFP